MANSKVSPKIVQQMLRHTDIEACVDTGVSLVAGNSRSVISREQAGFFLLGETEQLCCCAQIQDSTTFASANGGVGPLLLQARHVSDQSFQIVCG